MYARHPWTFRCCPGPRDAICVRGPERLSRRHSAVPQEPPKPRTWTWPMVRPDSRTERKTLPPVHSLPGPGGRAVKRRGYGPPSRSRTTGTATGTAAYRFVRAPVLFSGAPSGREYLQSTLWAGLRRWRAASCQPSPSELAVALGRDLETTRASLQPRRLSAGLASARTARATMRGNGLRRAQSARPQQAKPDSGRIRRHEPALMRADGPAGFRQTTPLLPRHRGTRLVPRPARAGAEGARPTRRDGVRSSPGPHHTERSSARFLRRAPSISMGLSSSSASSNAREI
jgi:hypothetical protein